MVRQYIGARYVPIFDGEYDLEKSYDPLTIVTYNYSSYTSRKRVPAGVLPTNTEYWALTGNYNAQVNEINNDLQNTKENINNKTKWYTTPEEYGAVGDGVTDDTTAVTNSIIDAIENDKIVILSAWYKVRKIDLTGVNERIFNLHISGQSANVSNYLTNGEFSGAGFISDTSNYVFDFPILHNAILENFGFNISNGRTAFRFAGGFECVIDNIHFGYHGRAAEFLSGAYWHFENCAINTDDEYALFINSTWISGAEYFYFENCQWAHKYNSETRDDYSGSVLKTTGNNFLSFNHCDLMGWNAAVEFVGSTTSKAFKIIDCQIGTNHICLRTESGVAGISGINILGCNIHVMHEYIMMASNVVFFGLEFTNNVIYTTPTLTTKNALFEVSNTKDSWIIDNYSIRIPGSDVFPPFTNYALSSSVKPGKYQKDKFYFTGVTGSQLSSGYDAVCRSSHLMHVGLPTQIQAFGLAFNSAATKKLDISNVTIDADGRTLTITVNSTDFGASAPCNVCVVIDY